MHFSPDELLSVFDPATLQRGRTYFRDGRVESLKINVGGDLISALVSGTHAQPYRCIINLDRNARDKLEVRGQCNCPMVYNCKHIVAVLLETAEQTQATRAAPVSATNYFVNEWLRRITQASAPAGTYPANVKERLLYVLQLIDQAAGPVLTVALQKVRVLKDGGYGQASRYGLNPQSSAHFILPADATIMHQLASRAFGLDMRLSDAWGAQLLRAMIDTGHAHWQSKDMPALRWSDTLTVGLTWCEDDSGKQRLSVDTRAGLLVLPLSPPCFFDAREHRCGLLDTGIDAALAGALIAGPALRTEEVEKLLPRLAELMPNARLPQPKKINVQHRADIRPVPHLMLGSVRASLPAFSRGQWGAGDEWLDYATLSFDYAGLRVSIDDIAPTRSHKTEDALLIITRDSAAEAQAVSALFNLAFMFSSSPKLPRGSFQQLTDVPDDWFLFIQEDIPELEHRGWVIEMDASFRFQMQEAEAWHAEIEDGGDWFKLGMGIDVEGKRIDLLPLLARMIQTMPHDFMAHLATLPEDGSLMIDLDATHFVRLPLARVRPILSTLAELFDAHALDKQGRLQLSKLHSPQLLDLAPEASWQLSGGEKLRAFAARLNDFTGIAKACVPKSFRAKLRPYQQDGLNWLQFLREYDLNGILADDMGLGKTVQTLAHLLLEKHSGRMDRPSLVVAPTSLVHNWRREAEQFAPELKVLVLHGSERKAQFERIAEHDLVLTTYPLLARDEDALLAQPYHLLILDEAQNIKNPRAQAAEVVRAIPARHRLCLTGTPMENHLGELWSLFHFLMPGLLGEEPRFKRLFRTPIEKHGDDERRKLLVRRIRPFLLRRNKSQVAKDLPPKTEIVRTVGLEGAQRDLYETVRAAMHKKVREAVEKKGLDRSRIVILDALLKLRQCCCDPRLLKLDAAKKVKQSAKLDLLMGMLPEMVEEGRRILLFSQFTSMLALIENELTARKLDYVKLTGDTRDRATPIDRFQAGLVPIFLISLKAGGTGLNLTAADTVIHYDPWWNPAVEAQATDRAHRIGQDKPVFVYKLLTEHTVEEKIAAMQLHKKALAEALLGEGGGKLKLNSTDLAQLFEPLG